MPLPQPQYGILRFAKYKGPQIGSIEAHNERTKEKYASNPDVDTSRSKRNFHLIKPTYKYRAEVERQITAAGCRTRKDSVRMVEALITASPEVFEGMKRSEIRAYFEYAMDFIKQKQDPSTIISAVVHMDEKTPHLHLCFVPLTLDGRLSAKEIIGNRKKLIQWQDEFWRHMVKKYPELERGESASQSGRDHIPPRVFKEMTHLTQQRKQLDQLLTGLTPFNLKSRSAEISKLLDGYIPAVEKMRTQLTKYRTAFTDTATENQKLKAENQTLTAALDKAQETSILKQLQDAQLQREYEAAIQTLESIPPEVIAFYKNPPPAEHQKESR
jgi:regulator of replication initiation timing